MDGAGSSLVRAVVATAELRLVMAAGGGGYGVAGRRRRKREEEEEKGKGEGEGEGEEEGEEEDAIEEEEEEEGAGGEYGGVGGGYGGVRLLLDESTARFAIRRPVATVMVPEKLMSRPKEEQGERDNNGVDVEQKARVGAWVSDLFGGGGGPGCKPGVIETPVKIAMRSRIHVSYEGEDTCVLGNPRVEGTALTGEEDERSRDSSDKLADSLAGGAGAAGREIGGGGGVLGCREREREGNREREREGVWNSGKERLVFRQLFLKSFPFLKSFVCVCVCVCVCVLYSK